MAVCTFFGHKDTQKEIEPTLQSTLIDLIENKEVDFFYIGNHGNFDFMVKKTLNQLKNDYPHINYVIVLSYMPNKKNKMNYSDTVLPDGLENTSPKYAIIKRNRWMIDKSDYVVTYVKRIFGGAAQFKELAEKKGKFVINLAEKQS